MRVLVISHTHHLLPIAWRLHQEGWQVDLIIDRDSYEKAWKGKLELRIRGQDKRSRQTIKALRAEAELDETPVLTDSPKWCDGFEGYPRLFGFIPRPPKANRLPPETVGAWFDGERFSGRHLLMESQGLWPGGMGPDLPGGVVMVSPRSWPEVFDTALDRCKDELKGRSYRGMVKVGFGLAKDDAKGTVEPELIGFQAGWNFLQCHALLAEAGDEGTASLTKMIRGDQDPSFAHRFTVAIPVSIPPYPHRATVSEASESRPIPSAAVKCGHIYWHDMMVEDGVMQTAGLDGLVGVVRASAENLYLAKTRALGFARLLTLPEIQLRPDVGDRVDAVLSGLEAGGLSV